MNLVIILFALTMFYIAVTSRLEAYAKMLSLQGILLFFLVAFDMTNLEWVDFLFLTCETLLIKAMLIPFFLLKSIRQNKIFREIEPFMSNFYSLFIVSIIFFTGSFVSFWSHNLGHDIKPWHFGIAFSTIITWMFIIMSRKKIITHIMGYMILENGIFLLSLATAKEMPLLVNLGILLDVFVAIYLFLIFFNKIQSEFKHTDIGFLTELKD